MSKIYKIVMLASGVLIIANVLIGLILDLNGQK